MTMAIDNGAKAAANRTAPARLKRDAGKLIADIEHNIGNRVGIAAGRESYGSFGPLRDEGAAIEPLNVLIVEEEPEIGLLLAEILAEFGHVVHAVEVDGAAAAISARDGNVDLIIVDIGLGETKRIAFVDQLLEEGFVPHIVVIADTLRGLAFAPEVALIQKPFHGSHLIAAIALTIEARGKAVRHASAQRNREPGTIGADDPPKRLS
jgi:CheY-like chemotaxis protein